MTNTNHPYHFYSRAARAKCDLSRYHPTSHDQDRVHRQRFPEREASTARKRYHVPPLPRARRATWETPVRGPPHNDERYHDDYDYHSPSTPSARTRPRRRAYSGSDASFSSNGGHVIFNTPGPSVSATAAFLDYSPTYSFASPSPIPSHLNPDPTGQPRSLEPPMGRRQPLQMTASRIGEEYEHASDGYWSTSPLSPFSTREASPLPYGSHTRPHEPESSLELPGSAPSAYQDSWGYVTDHLAQQADDFEHFASDEESDQRSTASDILRRLHGPPSYTTHEVPRGQPRLVHGPTRSIRSRRAMPEDGSPVPYEQDGYRGPGIRVPVPRKFWPVDTSVRLDSRALELEEVAGCNGGTPSFWGNSRYANPPPVPPRTSHFDSGTWLDSRAQERDLVDDDDDDPFWSSGPRRRYDTPPPVPPEMPLPIPRKPLGYDAQCRLEDRVRHQGRARHGPLGSTPPSPIVRRGAQRKPRPRNRGYLNEQDCSDRRLAPYDEARHGAAPPGGPDPYADRPVRRYADYLRMADDPDMSYGYDEWLARVDLPARRARGEAVVPEDYHRESSPESSYCITISSCSSDDDFERGDVSSIDEDDGDYRRRR